MNEHLIDMWNRTIKDEDTCYVLGDVAFGSNTEAIILCNRLKGRKVLICGNHDLGRGEWYWKDAGFNEVHKLGYGQTLPYKEFYLSHYPYRKALMEYDTRDYLFDHAAAETEVTLLHGHVHTQWKIRKNMVNVGVDVWGYRPVSIETIRDLTSAVLRPPVPVNVVLERIHDLLFITPMGTPK
jgi:calcineurin-like phosphoesterase family protein